MNNRELRQPRPSSGRAHKSSRSCTIAVCSSQALEGSSGDTTKRETGKVPSGGTTANPAPLPPARTRSVKRVVVGQTETLTSVGTGRETRGEVSGAEKVAVACGPRLFDNIGNSSSSVVAVASAGGVEVENRGVVSDGDGHVEDDADCVASKSALARSRQAKTEAGHIGQTTKKATMLAAAVGVPVKSGRDFESCRSRHRRHERGNASSAVGSSSDGGFKLGWNQNLSERPNALSSSGPQQTPGIIKMSRDGQTGRSATEAGRGVTVWTERATANCSFTAHRGIIPSLADAAGGGLCLRVEKDKSPARTATTTVVSAVRFGRARGAVFETAQGTSAIGGSGVEAGAGTEGSSTSSREEDGELSVGMTRAGEKPVTWAQCDGCQKWRRLHHVSDLSRLPKKWYCHLNVIGTERTFCR